MEASVVTQSPTAPDSRRGLADRHGSVPAAVPLLCPSVTEPRGKQEHDGEISKKENDLK